MGYASQNGGWDYSFYIYIYTYFYCYIKMHMILTHDLGKFTLNMCIILTVTIQQAMCYFVLYYSYHFLSLKELSHKNINNLTILCYSQV